MGFTTMRYQSEMALEITPCGGYNYCERYLT